MECGRVFKFAPGRSEISTPNYLFLNWEVESDEANTRRNKVGPEIFILCDKYRVIKQNGKHG